MISVMDLLVMSLTIHSSLERFRILSGAVYFFSYNFVLLVALNYFALSCHFVFRLFFIKIR